MAEDKILIGYGTDRKSYLALLAIEGSGDKTVIPIMTSNTSPEGRAFAGSIHDNQLHAPWKAFDENIDSSYWSKSGSGGGGGYLGYKFKQFIGIEKYEIYAGGSYTSMFPRNWTFEGSVNGINWDILDTQRDQTWNNHMWRAYKVNNTQPYKMYRLKWTANNGNNDFTVVTKLRMYSSSPQGVRVIHIPSLNEKYFFKYGVGYIYNDSLKFDYTEKMMISDTGNSLGQGKTFEHEVDLKKYEVNKIIT